jgi:hypothetical protein
MQCNVQGAVSRVPERRRSLCASAQEFILRAAVDRDSDDPSCRSDCAAASRARREPTPRNIASVD